MLPTSRAGKALLCACAICVSASHLVTSKAQTVLSLTFLLGVCLPPAHSTALETFSWARGRLSSQGYGTNAKLCWGELSAAP